MPDLPWEKTRTEQIRLHKMFEAANENVHLSSVLALHRASRTIHVDDTLMYVRLPLPMRVLGFRDLLSFHPTISCVPYRTDKRKQNVQAKLLRN